MDSSLALKKCSKLNQYVFSQLCCLKYPVDFQRSDLCLFGEVHESEALPYISSLINLKLISLEFSIYVYSFDYFFVLFVCFNVGPEFRSSVVSSEYGSEE